MCCGVEGSTYVDDLEAVLEELLGLVGEVVRDALEGGFVGLVDVDHADGSPESDGGVGVGV